MNGSLQQWLENCGSPPGLVACGLRQPDGKLICRGIEAGCPAEMMEKILVQFEDLRAAGFMGDLAPRWSTWNFDQGRVRIFQVGQPDRAQRLQVERRDRPVSVVVEAQSP